MKITKRHLRKIILEALSTEVPELSGGRRSSWQVRKEKELASKRQQRSMQANMQAVDDNIAQIAAELIRNPASVSNLLTTFQPAMDLDKHQQSMEGALRIDDFLDKVEKDLQVQGVDRITAIKFADSFLKFR